MEPLNADELAEVVAGRAVDGMKLYRSRTGATIPETKALVDAALEERGLPSPWAKFNPPVREANAKRARLWSKP